MANIYPSVMCANYLSLGEQIRSVEEGGADGLHLDIMDGHFVPGFTFGSDLIKQLSQFTSLPMDVHLMSDRPFDHMQEFLQLNIRSLTIHAESTYDLYRCIYTIKNSGVQAGIALNPGTPISILEELLPELDKVVIMTVIPGFIGQDLIKSALKKAETLVKKLKEMDLENIEVIVDGGVKIHNISEISALGIHGVVSGTGIFGYPNITEATRKMKTLSNINEGL